MTKFNIVGPAGMLCLRCLAVDLPVDGFQDTVGPFITQLHFLHQVERARRFSNGLFMGAMYCLAIDIKSNRKSRGERDDRMVLTIKVEILAGVTVSFNVQPGK